MKHYRPTALSLIALSLTWMCCNRSDAPAESGGKGGNAILKVFPQHHGNPIDSGKVYIKYNAQDAPTSYDDSVACIIENGKAVAIFTQLKKGSYYLSGSGWDSTILEKVKGGLPYKVEQETTLEMILPVSEQHQ
ncbi:MAG TPA: hypothetical protein VL098_05030 [Flavipsychrobacter sp.]|nr:hypothetical protein [Flavipsychrobacter sp.]